MNHELSLSSLKFFVCGWLDCGVSEETGQSAGCKKGEYQSVDSLDYYILVICYKWV